MCVEVKYNGNTATNVKELREMLGSVICYAAKIGDDFEISDSDCLCLVEMDITLDLACFEVIKEDSDSFTTVVRKKQ
jgi:hypothetical protein